MRIGAATIAVSGLPKYRERIKTMKNTYSIAQRNAIVEEKLYLVKAVMRENISAIRARHIEWDDVYQELSLGLITAVSSYDPNKGDIDSYIRAELKKALRSVRRYGSDCEVINAVPAAA